MEGKFPNQQYSFITYTEVLRVSINKMAGKDRGQCRWESIKLLFAVISNSIKFSIRKHAQNPDSARCMMRDHMTSSELFFSRELPLHVSAWKNIILRYNKWIQTET